MRDKLRGNLLAKVGALSALPIVILGVVLGQYLTNAIRYRAVEDAKQTATIAVRVGIQPQLSAADLATGLTPARFENLDQTLRRSGVLGTQIARVKIWNAQIKVVYSDDAKAIGQTFAASPELEGALAGQVTSEVSDLRKAENIDDRRYGQLLEVYVPLRVGADTRTSGAFEIYLPYRPIAATIASDSRRADALLLGGLALLYLALFRIVAQTSRTLRKQATANEYLARHDALTNLPNRAQFADRARDAVVDAGRSGSGLSVLLIDLDRFKEVNDTLGHQTGDELLRFVGLRLSSTLNADDSIARLGGDEFGVLLRSAPTPETAAAAASGIIASLREPFVLGGLSFEIDASVGVATYPADGADGDVLLQRADVAMYVAKERKTGFARYSPALDSYSPERLVLLGELRRAIARDELVLHFQPEIEIATGRVRAAEALVRWVHPTRGLLPPDAFIPLAEHIELIAPLTTWVLDHALAQCRRWKDAGVGLRVAVNLSPRNLHHAGFHAQVADLLRKWQVDPAQLQLEVTEGSVMADPAGAMVTLAQLRDLGVSIAIDDFGTGYSSLSYLKRLPVSDIKIDKSFVMNMREDVNDAVIVRSIIDLAHNLGLGVIAEGVENEESLRQLAVLGCGLAQGFLMCRPIPADEITAWLTADAGARAPA